MPRCIAEIHALNLASWGLMLRFLGMFSNSLSHTLARPLIGVGNGTKVHGSICEYKASTAVGLQANISTGRYAGWEAKEILFYLP